MPYVIHPLKGVNDIKFGDSVADVRRNMKSVPEELRRDGEIHPSDRFVEEGIVFYYDSDGRLESVEFDSESQVFLEGVDLFQLPVGRMIAFIALLDSQIVEEGGSTIFRRLSLAIWAPDDDDEGEDAPVEAFLTGRPGYYDFLDTL